MAYFFLYPILTVYVICSRRISSLLQPYLEKRFPNHSFWQRKLDTYKVVLEFGRVLVDRAWIGLKKDAKLTGHFIDKDLFEKILLSRRGVVVLLAHVGNWQTALADLKWLDRDIYSLMEYDRQEIGKHFFDLGRKRFFSIIDVRGFMGGMVEAATVLQKGAVVLTMADRYVSGPYAKLSFLGKPMLVPLAPYSLATSTGSAIVVLFSAKTGRNHYQLKIWDIIEPVSQGRADKKTLEGYAANFIVSLEKYVIDHPYQWFNFFDIWDVSESGKTRKTAVV